MSIFFLSVISHSCFKKGVIILDTHQEFSPARADIMDGVLSHIDTETEISINRKNSSPDSLM